MPKRAVSGTAIPDSDSKKKDDAPAAPPDKKPLVERASTVPALDAGVFGYYWEPTAGATPEWHVWNGDPSLFRTALADALLNKRMTRLFFAADGVWVQVPLPPINSV